MDNIEKHGNGIYTLVTYEKYDGEWNAINNCLIISFQKWEFNYANRLFQYLSYEDFTYEDAYLTPPDSHCPYSAYPDGFMGFIFNIPLLQRQQLILMLKDRETSKIKERSDEF